MANDTYKKRAKSNWRQGKGYKGDSEEREYAKKEIEETIQHDVLERPLRYKGKRKRNKKASLEHRISWCQQKIEELERQGYKGSSVDYLRDLLRKARKEYKKYGEE